jgi:biopolymer transport protein ExbB/TolQ
MNPKTPSTTRKVLTSSNVYTAFLGASLGLLVATAAYLVYQCLSQYGTLFSIPQ